MGTISTTMSTTAPFPNNKTASVPPYSHFIARIRLYGDDFGLASMWNQKEANHVFIYVFFFGGGYP